MSKPVTMIEEEHCTRWRLYDTDIVTFDKTTHLVTISTGGWLTQTTLKHINDVGEVWFNRLFRVAQSRHRLMVKIGDGEFIPYVQDTVEIPL